MRLTGRTRGFRPQTHTGRSGGAYATPCQLRKGVLDDPILQRVEGDNRHPSAGVQKVCCRLQCGADDVQLAVDLDADSLERPLGRVMSALARRRRDSRLDEFAKLPRCFDGVSGARGHDACRDAPGEALLAV